MTDNEKIKIEVDGQEIEARPGSMLIEATDAAGIYVPRFCYHKKLTVVANCRMCLVEVERAPKPMPACATPVMEGMKVYTRSEKAVSAQHATMEFLLINHPLDCPICDQGGECELQDLAMGYGSGISQFTEGKRVVRDKDIGPLVQTEMTRCIHCTRCVRFGEEIAGLRELGATGRGEHMEIGTYVQKSMSSELSGNVIDLCPVGALTNKPYRYSARTWELKQFDGIAPHDGLGSNVHFHVKGQTVKRIVPKENNNINETWLSDRDRYSYQGLNHAARATLPRIKVDGKWKDFSWDDALDAVSSGLLEQANKAPDETVALASASSTTEEFCLLQKITRGLKTNNVDHRLRQTDFSYQEAEPLYPAIGNLADLENADAVLLVGAYPRHEQPLLNLRIRKAALKGCKIINLDTHARPFNYGLSDQIIVRPSMLPDLLDKLVKCLRGLGEPDDLLAIATKVLSESKKIAIVVGAGVQNSPSRGFLLSSLDQLVGILSATKVTISDGANAAGAWLAGAVPHRGPGGILRTDSLGIDSRGLFIPRKNFLLMGIDPLLDSADPLTFKDSLEQAEMVVAMTSFITADIEALATIILPTAIYAENEGTYVNGAGQWQSFNAAVKPPFSARPSWKILRALGERLGLVGFDAVTATDITDAVRLECGAGKFVARTDLLELPASISSMENHVELIIEVPMYRSDALVRHAAALQDTIAAGQSEMISLSSKTAAFLKLNEGDKVTARFDNSAADLLVAINDGVSDGSGLMYGANSILATFASYGDEISLISNGGEEQ
jgi:NADH-quinone oxidoreductase subunit G